MKLTDFGFKNPTGSDKLNFEKSAKERLVQGEKEHKGAWDNWTEVDYARNIHEELVDAGNYTDRLLKGLNNSNTKIASLELFKKKIKETHDMLKRLMEIKK